MQGRNRDTDVENGHVDTGGWGKGRVDEVGDEDGHIYTTTRKIDSWWEPAIKHRKLSSVLCDDLLDGWDGGEGSPRGRGYMYADMADSLHCTAETNTTL